jgi:hypothetical protein
MRLGAKQVSPTGLTLWPLGDDLSIVWRGPGSRLLLGINATKPGGSLSLIEHPTANDVYHSREDAARAARAFVEAA